jgi:regulator of RNase E activity RraA
MVGDADSVIVIPAEIADEVAVEATEMTAYEDFAIEQVRTGQSIIGLYPATHPKNLDAFQEWRKKNNR